MAFPLFSRTYSRNLLSSTNASAASFSTLSKSTSSIRFNISSSILKNYTKQEKLIIRAGRYKFMPRNIKDPKNSPGVIRKDIHHCLDVIAKVPKEQHELRIELLNNFHRLVLHQKIQPFVPTAELVKSCHTQRE